MSCAASLITVPDPTACSPKAATWGWSLPAIVLIQVGYWVPHRLGPSTPRFVNIVLRHVVLCLARLIFLLPVAFFSIVFINNRLENQMPFSRYVLLLVGLFSLFCYSLDLRRYGTAMLGPALAKLGYLPLKESLCRKPHSTLVLSDLAT